MTPQTPNDRYDHHYHYRSPLRRRFESHTPPAEDIADALAAGVALSPDWLAAIDELMTPEEADDDQPTG